MEVFCFSQIVAKPSVQTGVEQPPMQILVVVANIQVRYLKTEVEKGSTATVVGRGLVGPKR